MSDLPTDRAALVRAYDQGRCWPLTMFWGHTPPADGQPGAWLFSQWAQCPFVIGDHAFPTAEHWMMAEKARVFGDDAMFRAILAADSPAVAKKLGRKVADFDDAVWKAKRVGIVRNGNFAKFSQNPAAREVLASTAGTILVEAAPRDQIWGIGLGRDNPRARDPRTWRGSNLLGFALTWVREKLSE